MDEPVPIRRAAIGCLLIVLAGLAFALVIRPAIFSLAPPRDDAAVTVTTTTEVAGQSVTRDVVLSRAYGWAGERDAGSGRVQLRVILVPIRFGAIAAFAGTSPGHDGCPITVEETRLRDCDGRTWTLEGLPIDPADGPPLDRFAVAITSGSVTVDLTRRMEPAASP